MKIGTKVIHGGLSPDPATGAIMTPIYQTTTYHQPRPGEHQGYEYSRSKNPTRDALEKNLAAIENGKYGLCFGSGMAAIDAILKLLNPGDEVISTGDLYGGSYRLFTQVFEKFGIKFHFTEMNDFSKLDALVNEKTKLVWVETPTNPMLNLIDLNKAAHFAKKHNCLLGVDNTFASPYLQNPLDFGADIVMHSATKYLGGHSDVVMGALVVNDEKLAEKLYFIQNSSGAICGPMDAFLVLRGIKTLHIRMQRHCENGEKVAEFLNNHSAIDNMYWPGLVNHPNHEIAKSQMRGFGGMVSFNTIDDNYDAAKKIVSNVKVFSLAESLGGVESLCGHPASMTHAAIPKEEREKNGIKDSLIRLSIGIEDAEDLIADLKQAIEL